MVVLHANRSLRSSIDATFAMFMRSCMTTINAKVVLNVYNVIAIVASVDFCLLVMRKQVNIERVIQ